MAILGERQAARISVLLAMFTSTALGSRVQGDDSHAAPTTMPTTARIIAPSLGRPLFAQPGEQLRISAVGLDGRWSFALSAARLGPRPIPLEVLTEAASSGEPAGGIVLRVPDDAPHLTYDLIATNGDERCVARHAVCVWESSRRVRVALLGDFRIGDPLAPRIDRRLIDELNLFAPTVIVCTGNYVDPVHPDPDSAWVELIDSLSELDAPLIMSCGDLDDLGRYGEHIAASPIGGVCVGPFRVLVLYDTVSSPLSDDSPQRRWATHELASGTARQTIVVSYLSPPSLISWLRHESRWAEISRNGRIGAWLHGPDSSVVRTQAHLADSGTAIVESVAATSIAVDGASGLSRFRLFELDGGRLYFGDRETANDGVSAITGDVVESEYEANVAGLHGSVGVIVRNRTALATVGVRRWLSVRTRDPASIRCFGGEIEQIISRGNQHDVAVRFDLPDLGVARVLLTTVESGIPPLVAVRVSAPRGVSQDPADPAMSNDSDAWDAVAELQNLSDGTVDVTPVVRFGGQALPYRIEGRDAPPALAYHLRLPPGVPVTLRIAAPQRMVRPGRHMLQVSFLGPAWVAPQWTPVIVATAR